MCGPYYSDSPLMHVQLVEDLFEQLCAHFFGGEIPESQQTIEQLCCLLEFLE